MSDATMERMQLAWASEIHRHLGLELVSVAADRIVARVAPRRELRGRVGREVMHGGAIATLLDSTCGFMARIAIQPHLAAMEAAEAAKRKHNLSTLDLHIDYIRPLEGGPFTAKAVVVHAGKSIVRTRGEVFDEAESLVAHAVINFRY